MIRNLKLVSLKEKEDLLNSVLGTNNMDLNENDSRRIIKDMIECFNPYKDYIYASYSEGKIDGFVFLKTVDIVPSNKNNIYLTVTERINKLLEKIGVDVDILITFVNCSSGEDCDICERLLRAIEYDLKRKNMHRICFFTSNPEWFNWSYEGGFELSNTLEIDLNDVVTITKPIYNLRVFTKRI